ARAGGTGGPYGTWILEQRALPRAFLVSRVVRAQAPLRLLRNLDVDPERVAVTAGLGFDEPGLAGEAQLQRDSPERMRIVLRAPGRRRQGVSEHFDPGWRARVDGASAPVLRV